MLRDLRVCIWMKGETDCDLWGFKTDKPFDQFVAALFELEIYIGQKSALRTSEIVKMSLYDKPADEGFQPNYY